MGEVDQPGAALSILGRTMLPWMDSFQTTLIAVVIHLSLKAVRKDQIFSLKRGESQPTHCESQVFTLF